MKKTNFSRDSILCSISIAIIILLYGFEKILESFIVAERQHALILAMIYAFFSGVVVYVLAKCESPFYGLITALIGYKMMPVPILFLHSVSLNGSFFYYLLTQAIKIIFIIMLYRFYSMQKKLEPTQEHIQTMPILMMMFSVPFFAEIANKMVVFFSEKTGSMLGGYFSEYLCYAIATASILVTASFSNQKSKRFTVYFEYTALVINSVRVGGKIIVKAIHDVHISKSLYGWLLLYALLFLLVLIFWERYKQPKATANQP